MQWEFEKDFHKIFKVPSLVIDALEKKPTDFGLPHKYVDAWIGSSNIGHIRTLSSILDEYLDPGSSFVLQMDIEGMEYESIIALDEEQLKLAHVLIIELHYLENLLNPIFIKYVFLPFVKKLNKTHSVIFLNGNTYNDLITFQGIKWPRVLEITAIAKNGNYVESDLIFEYEVFSEYISNEGLCFDNAEIYWFNRQTD